MSKFEGYSFSSSYVLEFETVEDIAEHINDNLILLADIEENNGNEVRAEECDMSRDILQDYMNQYDGETWEKHLTTLIIFQT